MQGCLGPRNIALGNRFPEMIVGPVAYQLIDTYLPVLTIKNKGVLHEDL